MNKICKKCGASFLVREEDLEFYKKVSPIINGVRFDIPAPSFCPKCRLVRRFMDRNTRCIYYRKCDFSGKKILSQYHENQLFPVYENSVWWGDKWSALDYGRVFDFSRPFFEQFLDLKNSVPHLALFNIGTLGNSEYNNCTGYLKNCYLIFESDYCSDAYYSNLLKNCNFVVDCSVCAKAEFCYECVDCRECYNLFYSQDCYACGDSYFLNDCSSCSDCIGCVNLRQKKYCIFNVQYSKEEYEKLKKNFAFGSGMGVEDFKIKFENFVNGQFHREFVLEENENCSGNYLFNSRNAYECFDCSDVEDCSYCAKLSLNVSSSMDYNSWGDNSELMYECSSSGNNCYNLKFCTNCTSNMRDCDYCAGCFSCSDCFGCVGLKRASFCILNKQYSEKEYFVLKAKIIKYMQKIGEWGGFFPLELCPFAYNESMIMDVFPLSESEALENGFKWYEENSNQSVVQTCDIADDISEIDGSVLSELLTCDCGKNFKIMKEEFAFYKKMGVPIPKNCASCRHGFRIARRRRYYW